MKRRHLIQVCSLTAVALAAPLALAQSAPFKIGLVLPMTGQQASTGRQIEAAARLYMAQNGDTVAGRKIELIVKDDTSLPDVTKRLAQELIVNDKVDVLAGMGITPSAMATAPLATQSKTPLVVMAAATSSITNASPYIVRSSFTLPQVSVAMGDWAPKNGIKSVVTLVSDYGPGNADGAGTDEEGRPGLSDGLTLVLGLTVGMGDEVAVAAAVERGVGTETSGKNSCRR